MPRALSFLLGGASACLMHVGNCMIDFGTSAANVNLWTFGPYSATCLRHVYTCVGFGPKEKFSMPIHAGQCWTWTQWRNLGQGGITRSIFRLLPTEQLELQMANFCRKADIPEGRFNENFLAAVAIIILGPFNIQVSALRAGRGDRLAAAELGSVACRSFNVMLFKRPMRNFFGASPLYSACVCVCM